jgi:hypothetical protein
MLVLSQSIPARAPVFYPRLVPPSVWVQAVKEQAIFRSSGCVLPPQDCMRFNMALGGSGS